MERIDRRSVLAAAALAGCGRHESNRMAVSIRRVAGYGAELVSPMRQVLREHNVVVKGKRVVLKPNLVEFSPDRPINTNPAFVLAALEAFRAEGAASVRIAEGPGHRRGTLDLSEAAGYFQTIPGFEDLFTDLNWAEVERVEIPSPKSTLREIYLPKLVRHCDLLVSLPKLKTHHWVGATLSMKNFFGMVPGGVYGWPKNPLHWAGINEVIADLSKLTPPTFAFVDGIVGMEGNGPIEGVAKPAGVLIAGADLPSVDATACRVMGIDPLRLPYLRLAREEFVLQSAQIEQRGESPLAVRTDFALIPQHAMIRLAAGA